MRTLNFVRICRYALLLLVSIMLVGCDLGQGDGYSIGDIGPSGVGIVFYVTDGGLHGLEAAPSSWSGSADDPIAPWSNVGTSAGASGVAIGTGSANTASIVAQDGHTESAAALCQDYAGGSLNDWFLPSKDELHQLYLRRNSVGGFRDEQYWFSSEGVLPNITACFQHFHTGVQNNGGWKNSALASGGGIPDFTGNAVRPIRAF